MPDTFLPQPKRDPSTFSVTKKRITHDKRRINFKFNNKKTLGAPLIIHNRTLQREKNVLPGASSGPRTATIAFTRRPNS